LNHHTEQQLKALSNKVKDHRMRMRLLAVAHFNAGKNKADVARTLNFSRRMVNEWVANYLKGGVSALESKKTIGNTLSIVFPAKSRADLTSRNKVSLQVGDV
jgi:DNA-binding transcriptional regulator LsrR (DeoR family)